MIGKALKQKLKCQILPISSNKLVLLVLLNLGTVEKKHKYTVHQLEEIKRANKKKVEPNTASGLSLFQSQHIGEF